MNTTIDLSAPVVSRVQRHIAAPLATLWRLHVDVARWPTWQEDVIETAMDDDFAPGTTFIWRTRGIKDSICSSIHAVEPEHCTMWGGLVTA